MVKSWPFGVYFIMWAVEVSLLCIAHMHGRLPHEENRLGLSY